MIQKKEVLEKNRLDVAVGILFSLTRSQAQKAIKEGRVLVNGEKKESPSFKAMPGREVTLDALDPEQIKVPKKPTIDVKLDFVYQDKDISILNKPRGRVVHPAPGHDNNTIVNYLLNEDFFDFDVNDSDDLRPGIVHRIDKDTSGLLAIANNKPTQSALSEEIKERDFHRSYLALVYGNVKDKRFKIDAPLTRPNHTERKAVVDVYKGRDAITHCTLLASTGKVSLLKVTLETGRTHQIRAHLAYIGYPIVGDPLYGRKNDEKIASKGQALHAYSLSLIHPGNRKRRTFYAPIDDYFKKLLIYFFKTNI